MPAPRTVDEVLARLRAIDSALPYGDGVAVFNRMYLTVTERIAERLAGRRFADAATTADLGVRFAALWLEAFDADAGRRRPSAAWRPLFEARAGGRLPVQYAIAGMNSHIEHDLPVAVVRTCEARGLQPGDLRRDYDEVNEVLFEVEAEIRRGFLDEVGRAVDDRIGPVVHLLSSWHIDKARDLAWVSAETLWTLRPLEPLHDRFLSGLGSTVGMTSRALLTPVC